MNRRAPIFRAHDYRCSKSADGTHVWKSLIFRRKPSEIDGDATTIGRSCRNCSKVQRLMRSQAGHYWIEVTAKVEAKDFPGPKEEAKL